MVLFHRVRDLADLRAQMEKAITLTDWEARTIKAYEYAAKYLEIRKIADLYEETYKKLLDTCAE